MKVLIIEDEEKLALALKEGLEKEGFAADFVTDGEKGERRLIFYGKDYDLVVLDLLLPGKDGLSILKEIRARNISVPVLMLTAKDGAEDIVSCLNAGADDYLVKPFVYKEFFARIRALLRRPKKTFHSELRAGDLTLNSFNKKVFCRGKEIKLTLKEFGLLELLMRYPGRVVSREEAIFNLWGFDFDSFSNIVDVHIKNLRKKIDPLNEKKILETVRGVGYRIRN